MKGQKDSKGKIPIYTMLIQFKKALTEVAKCTQKGHNKYKLDSDYMNFKRVENPEFEYKNAAFRHSFKEGIDQDDIEYGEVLHEAAVIWNLLANLEIKLENNKVPSEKELADFNLRELVKEYSNDMELGMKIRELVK